MSVSSVESVAQAGDTSEGVEDADRRLVDRFRQIPANYLVAGGAFLLIVVVVLVRNRWILSTGRFEDSDYAANSILIDDARHLRLLVGNYSRIEFNHPGPALLYVQAVGQVFLYDLTHLLARPFNAHVFSIVIFDAALIGCSASIVTRRTGSRMAGMLVPVLSLALVMAQPGVLASTLFPDIYIWPFLLMSIAVASVISGEPRDLPLALLGICLLVHGHVSFVLFAVGMSVLMVASLIRQHRRGGPTITRRTWWLSGGVVFLFVLPMIINFPGDFGKYWHYSRSGTAGGHSLSEVLHFMAQYWSADSMGALLVLGLLVAALLAVVGIEQTQARAFSIALLVVVVAVCALTFIYTYRGVDNLAFRYIAEFFLIAPILVVLTVGVAVIARTAGHTNLQRGLAGVLIVVAVGLASTSNIKAYYPGANWIPAADAAIDESLPPGTMRVFQFPDLYAWQPVVGLVEEARRHGEPVCVDAPNLYFLFTQKMICTPDQKASGIAVVAALPDGPQPTLDSAATKVYDGGGVRLWVLPPATG